MAQPVQVRDRRTFSCYESLSDKSKKIKTCRSLKGHFQSLRRTGSSGGSSGGMSLGDVRMRRVDSQLINMPDNVAMRHRTESGMVFGSKFRFLQQKHIMWLIFSHWNRKIFSENQKKFWQWKISWIKLLMTYVRGDYNKKSFIWNVLNFSEVAGHESK